MYSFFLANYCYVMFLLLFLNLYLDKLLSTAHQLLNLLNNIELRCSIRLTLTTGLFTSKIYLELFVHL